MLWNEITNVITMISNLYNGLEVIRYERKAFYIKGMRLRLDNVLLLTYELKLM